MLDTVNNVGMPLPRPDLHRSAIYELTWICSTPLGVIYFPGPWNARDVGKIPTLGIYFPFLSLPMTYIYIWYLSLLMYISRYRWYSYYISAVQSVEITVGSGWWRHRQSWGWGGWSSRWLVQAAWVPELSGSCESWGYSGLLYSYNSYTAHIYVCLYCQNCHLCHRYLSTCTQISKKPEPNCIGVTWFYCLDVN